MIWFTADLHLMHANIIDYCPGRGALWDSPEAMTLGIIDRWNNVVGDNDTVYVLGDVAMGKIAESLPLVGMLRGTKKLVPGNHDRCWPHLKNWEKWTDRYEAVGFEILDTEVEMYLGDCLPKALLCHFPFDGDHTDEERFGAMRPTKQEHPKCDWLFHGHVHDEWRIRGNQINVGVDAWDYYPVAIDTLTDIITNQGEQA